MAALFLIVGLPGAGKTTRARELAARHAALRLTPDDWMIPLYGDSDAGGHRDVLEGRLVWTAEQLLRLGTDVVLDFGFWGRDERASLHWLARSIGATCTTTYLAVDRATQLARVARRWESEPHRTFLMTDVEVDRWRAQFEAPDDAELAGHPPVVPPAGWTTWADWITERWPSSDG